MNEMMASQPGGAGAGSAASSLPTETKALPPPAKIWKPAPVTKRPSEENVPHRTASNSSLRSLTRGAPGGPAPGSGSISPRARKEASIANALVHPILTPRFAISCSDAMLAGIAALLARDPTREWMSNG